MQENMFSRFAEEKMAKNKFYAVRKGKETGIFKNWEDCQRATAGYSGAEFKGFSVLEEAQHYLKNDTANVSVEETDPKSKRILAYVDGSFDKKIKKYSFGCVLLTPSGETIKKCGNGDHPESLAIRNVAGEMLGAMYAVKWAMKNGYSQIEIRYDYEGIEKWVTGAWRAKNELTQKYAKAMNEWKKNIQITFLKVTAHSNNKYNDMADALAKEALTGADGIPPISQE